MKISTEVKLGVIGIITAAVIIWGINYLKGQYILSGNRTLIAMYNNAGGLEPSAGVMLDGFNIGVVDEIKFDTETKPHFTVILKIKKKYMIRKGSTAEIYNADLLGTKAIKIIQSGSTENAVSGDTLKSNITGDLLSSLVNDISPLTVQLKNTVATIDSVGISINRILSDPAIDELINSIKNASGSLDEQFSETGNLSKTLNNLRMLSDSLYQKSNAIANTLSNLQDVSAELRQAHLEELVIDFHNVVSNLSEITGDLRNNTGTIGKLINEDSIYDKLNLMIADFDSLINDINEHPEKYVNFSIF
ncbi:MAG: MlaD family protein [Bacteroidales bacterium]|nr:MlaD family protein [Bacteroidales bacterium]